MTRPTLFTVSPNKPVVSHFDAVIDGKEWTPAGLKITEGRPDIYKLLKTDSRRFNDVCLANFGDHATVTATVDGFVIEYFDHE